MPPRYTDEQREDIRETNRQRLLEEAAKEIATAGYQRANTNRISKAAGFASGTIFNYFPTKKDLILALLDETAKAHFEAIASAVQAIEEADQRLVRFFQVGFEFVAQNLAPARVMVNTIYGPDEDLKVHLYQAYLPMFQFVAQEIVALGIERDIFRQVDPTEMANLLMNIYLGSASQVNDDGQFLISADPIADFAKHALRR
jgi:AcrR family transcriptional regulator